MFTQPFIQTQIRVRASYAENVSIWWRHHVCPWPPLVHSPAAEGHKKVDPYGKLPKEFTWVVNGRVGGMAFPDNEEYFRFLANQNVGYVVSLTEEPAKTSIKGWYKQVPLWYGPAELDTKQTTNVEHRADYEDGRAKGWLLGVFGDS